MAKSLVSPKNNMNIYRGCTHGCIYCDSRSEVYGKTYDFEDIEVKTNAIELLRGELARRRHPCMITTGAMTDPYLPLEGELLYTRRCLEVIEEFGFGVALLTKSDLILRDLDILKRINKATKCVVQMTLTTFDEELCQIVEPNVCTTKRRFEALCKLRDAGIPTIVWLTPILPFINDTPENIAGILSYCKEAGVRGILSFGMGMTLRYGNREYYYKALKHHFPDLVRKYMLKYGASYGLASPNSRKLTAMVRSFCKENSLLYGEREIFSFVQDFDSSSGQMSLFDGM